ncbi:hypothetical protein BDZ89DRAFT_1059985, partial [Hymenopellis radicata]
FSRQSNTLQRSHCYSIGQGFGGARHPSGSRSVLRPQYATVLVSIPFLLPRCPHNPSMSSNE